MSHIGFPHYGRPQHPTTAFRTRNPSKARIALWLSQAHMACGGLALDAALFFGAAVFAAITAFNRTLPAHGAWGRIAVWGYAAASATALGALWAHRNGWRRFTGLNIRVTLCILVFVASAMLPLVIEAVQATTGRLDRAQGEVRAVEASGRRLWNTGSPYLDREELAALPANVQIEGYVPYQPGMALFGLPRTFAGTTWWTDARVWFALTLVGTLLAAVWLLRRPGDPAQDRVLLRAAQTVLVLPNCALAIATGGDDLPVLGFCLLGFALAARQRFGLAGVAIGIAGALKLFAWPIAAVLLVLAVTKGLAPAIRFAGSMIMLSFGVLIPPLLIARDAVIENLIRLPLGRGVTTSTAASPLPGHLIAEGLPGGKAVATAMVFIVGVAFAGWLVRSPPRTAAAAAGVSAWGLLAAILLMPATRFGYLLYPITYAVWTAALSDRAAVDSHSPRC